jgi:hypothetical protein
MLGILAKSKFTWIIPLIYKSTSIVNNYYLTAANDSTLEYLITILIQSGYSGTATATTTAENVPIWLAIMRISLRKTWTAHFLKNLRNRFD